MFRNFNSCLSSFSPLNIVPVSFSCEDMFSLWMTVILAVSSAQSPLTSSSSQLTPSPSKWPSLSASSSISPTPPQKLQIFRPQPIFLPPGPLPVRVASQQSNLTPSPSHLPSSQTVLLVSSSSTPSLPRELKIPRPLPINVRLPPLSLQLTPLQSTLIPSPSYLPSIVSASSSLTPSLSRQQQIPWP